ncbi:MAG TPA: hypothetical protein DEF45_12960 [Rhodopirellula sp.]|nr:hypothetical protein [Rhodopirellula sp.]
MRGEPCVHGGDGQARGPFVIRALLSAISGVASIFPHYADVRANLGPAAFSGAFFNLHWAGRCGPETLFPQFACFVASGL